MYERFTPFADDGWEWTMYPGDPTFDGWVYEHVDGRLTVIGVHLICRRIRLPDPNWRWICSTAACGWSWTRATRR